MSEMVLVAVLAFSLLVIAMVLAFLAHSKNKEVELLKAAEAKRLPHKEVLNRENASALIAKMILANMRDQEYNQAMLHMVNSYLNKDRFGDTDNKIPAVEADEFFRKMNTMIDGMMDAK